MPISKTVQGVNKDTTELYANINGVNKEIKEAYACVNGVNKIVYSSAPPPLLQVEKPLPSISSSLQQRIIAGGSDIFYIQKYSITWLRSVRINLTAWSKVKNGELKFTATTGLIKENTTEFQDTNTLSLNLFQLYVGTNGASGGVYQVSLPQIVRDETVISKNYSVPFDDSGREVKLSLNTVYNSGSTSGWAMTLGIKITNLRYVKDGKTTYLDIVPIDETWT